MTGETGNALIPINVVIDTEKRDQAIIDMLVKEKNQPIKLLLVGTGGEFEHSMELARIIAEKNYAVEVITPRQAKEMQLKPAEGIVELKNYLPEMHQYYPPSLVEPNRRERRKQERNNKRKRK